MTAPARTERGRVSDIHPALRDAIAWIEESDRRPRAPDDVGAMRDFCSVVEVCWRVQAGRGER